MSLRPFVFTALTAAACGDDRGIDLERMIEQRYYQPFERSPLFADQRAMRPPPAGTIPRGRVLGNPTLTQGATAGEYSLRIPVPIDRPLLERGRNRYEIFCAVCHGSAGRGQSVVAHNMELRKPPSLVDEPVRGSPPGRVFAVVTQGYGLMPAYERDLGVRDRWAVVAYLRALQTSQGVRLQDLPSPVRAAAEAALP